MTKYWDKGKYSDFYDLGDLKVKFEGYTHNHEPKWEVFLSEYNTLYPVIWYEEIKNPDKPTFEEKVKLIETHEGGFGFSFYITEPEKYLKKEFLQQIHKNMGDDEIYKIFNINIDDETTYLKLLDIDEIYEELELQERGYLVIYDERIMDPTTNDGIILTNTELFEIDLLMNGINREKINKLFNTGFKVPDYYVYMENRALADIFRDIEDNRSIEWYFNYEYDRSLCEKIVELIDKLGIREYTYENINKIKNEIEDEYFDKKDYGGFRYEYFEENVEKIRKEELKIKKDILNR